MNFANDIGMEGASITAPFKEEALEYLSWQSAIVQAVGACNTLVRLRDAKGRPTGWQGYNTDAQAFTESVFKKPFRHKKITIIGAGGLAKAIAADVYRRNGRALILDRSALKAKNVADKYGFKWGGLDEWGLKLMRKYSNLIVQATSCGMYPNVNDDPFPAYDFTGHETVLDAVFKPERTKFLKRAEEAGCRVFNGRAMLKKQAMLQYTYFTGMPEPRP
jgi:3-dehydroquinate dehydratase/shikimate dehydrogenase